MSEEPTSYISVIDEYGLEVFHPDHWPPDAEYQRGQQVMFRTATPRYVTLEVAAVGRDGSGHFWYRYRDEAGQIHEWRPAAAFGPPRPVVVCLCGSTRFSEAFHDANLRETLAGRIVLSIGCDFKSDDALGLTEDDKVRLDALHLRKIDLADEVLILNVDGYIGQSTTRELAYARQHGKRIRFLELDKAPRA